MQWSSHFDPRFLGCSLCCRRYRNCNVRDCRRSRSSNWLDHDRMRMKCSATIPIRCRPAKMGPTKVSPIFQQRVPVVSLLPMDFWVYVAAVVVAALLRRHFLLIPKTSPLSAIRSRCSRFCRSKSIGFDRNERIFRPRGNCSDWILRCHCDCLHCCVASLYRPSYAIVRWTRSTNCRGSNNPKSLDCCNSNWWFFAGETIVVAANRMVRLVRFRCCQTNGPNRNGFWWQHSLVSVAKHYYL